MAWHTGWSKINRHTWSGSLLKISMFSPRFCFPLLLKLIKENEICYLCSPMGFPSDFVSFSTKLPLKRREKIRVTFFTGTMFPTPILNKNDWHFWRRKNHFFLIYFSGIFLELISTHLKNMNTILHPSMDVNDRLFNYNY